MFEGNSQLLDLLHVHLKPFHYILNIPCSREPFVMHSIPFAAISCFSWLLGFLLIFSSFSCFSVSSACHLLNINIAFTSWYMYMYHFNQWSLYIGCLYIEITGFNFALNVCWSVAGCLYGKSCTGEHNQVGFLHWKASFCKFNVLFCVGRVFVLCRYGILINPVQWLHVFLHNPYSWPSVCIVIS